MNERVSSERIELKIGEFLPKYVGKMQFYLAALDDTARLEDENPSIGIIARRAPSDQQSGDARH